MSWNGEAEILPLLQYVVQVAVVIGPDPDTGRGFQALTLAQQRSVERRGRGREEQPVGPVDPRVVVVAVVDLAQLQRQGAGGLLHYRDEVEVAVGDVHRED